MYTIVLPNCCTRPSSGSYNLALRIVCLVWRGLQREAHHMEVPPHTHPTHSVSNKGPTQRGSRRQQYVFAGGVWKRR